MKIIIAIATIVSLVGCAHAPALVKAKIAEAERHYGINQPAPPRISLKNAGQINDGMTRSQVRALVGEPTSVLHKNIDVYSVPRNGNCGLDRVAISYVDERPTTIHQQCDDPTSNERRGVEYNFRMELPDDIAQLKRGTSRAQVHQLIGYKQPTGKVRDLGGAYADVITLQPSGREIELVFRPGLHTLTTVRTNGGYEVTTPVVKSKKEHFE